VRVALYGRVSTLHNQNPEMQLAELREHATRRGWTVVGEYIDRISGARERRTPAISGKEPSRSTKLRCAGVPFS
jgi:DNA invertase Pin-like site-specific DNA recombinase